jgi:hypothetical protein
MFPGELSPWTSCSDCGLCLERTALDEHSCEKERFVEFQMLRLRSRLSLFAQQFSAWADTPNGRFAVYCAERERRLSAPA